MKTNPLFNQILAVLIQLKLQVWWKGCNDKNDKITYHGKILLMHSDRNFDNSHLITHIGFSFLIFGEKFYRYFCSKSPIIPNNVKMTPDIQKEDL